MFAMMSPNTWKENDTVVGLREGLYSFVGNSK